MSRKYCDFCGKESVYFVNENDDAYCLQCLIEANEKQSLKNATAVDFNSSAGCKPCGFFERFG